MNQLHTVTRNPENFDAPVNKVSSTCRLGRKWLDVEPGQTIELTLGATDSDRNFLGIARVLRTEHLKFCDLESRHIRTNHIKVSRKPLAALQAAMGRAYGLAFTPTAPVTVLFYERIQ